MIILVTGATSVIGIPLIRRLLEEKNKVYAMVRPNSSSNTKMEEFCNDENLIFVELDLENGNRLIDLINESIDVCIHLGWAGPGSENRKKRDVQQKNVDSSMKILKACAALNCKRFIFSGSQAEYGPCMNVIDERTECHPLSEYAKAKIDFMNQAIEYLKESSTMQYIHTRIFSIYGPNDHEGSLVNSCINAFKNGGRVELGRGEHLWNYLYIDDLIEAYVTLIKNSDFKRKFIVYNIAGEKEETRPLKDYVQIIHEKCGNRGTYVLGTRPENAEGAANLSPCIEKIVRETGWIPKVTFEEGIKTILKLRS